MGRGSETLGKTPGHASPTPGQALPGDSSSQAGPSGLASHRGLLVQPVRGWSCPSLVTLTASGMGSSPAPLTKPEGRGGVHNPSRRRIVPGRSVSPKPRLLHAGSLSPSWGLDAPVHSWPRGPWRAGNPRITEDVVDSSVAQCRRDPMGGPVTGGGGGHTLPRQLRKGSGLGKTKNTFGPQCLILKPLCILREI